MHQSQSKHDCYAHGRVSMNSDAAILSPENVRISTTEPRHQHLHHLEQRQYNNGGRRQPAGGRSRSASCSRRRVRSDHSRNRRGSCGWKNSKRRMSTSHVSVRSLDNNNDGGGGGLGRSFLSPPDHRRSVSCTRRKARSDHSIRNRRGSCGDGNDSKRRMSTGGGGCRQGSSSFRPGMRRLQQRQNQNHPKREGRTSQNPANALDDVKGALEDDRRDSNRRRRVPRKQDNSKSASEDDPGDSSRRRRFPRKQDIKGSSKEDLNDSARRCQFPIKQEGRIMDGRRHSCAPKVPMICIENGEMVDDSFNDFSSVCFDEEVLQPNNDRNRDGACHNNIVQQQKQHNDMALKQQIGGEESLANPRICIMKNQNQDSRSNGTDLGKTTVENDVNMNDSNDDFNNTEDKGKRYCDEQCIDENSSAGGESQQDASTNEKDGSENTLDRIEYDEDTKSQQLDTVAECDRPQLVVRGDNGLSNGTTEDSMLDHIQANVLDSTKPSKQRLRRPSMIGALSEPSTQQHKDAEDSMIDHIKPNVLDSTEPSKQRLRRPSMVGDLSEPSTQQCNDAEDSMIDHIKPAMLDSIESPKQRLRRPSMVGDLSEPSTQQRNDAEDSMIDHIKPAMLDSTESPKQRLRRPSMIGTHSGPSAQQRNDDSVPAQNVPSQFTSSESSCSACSKNGYLQPERTEADPQFMQFDPAVEGAVQMADNKRVQKEAEAQEEIDNNALLFIDNHNNARGRILDQGSIHCVDSSKPRERRRAKSADHYSRNIGEKKKKTGRTSQHRFSSRLRGQQRKENHQSLQEKSVKNASLAEEKRRSSNDVTKKKINGNNAIHKTKPANNKNGAKKAPSYGRSVNPTPLRKRENKNFSRGAMMQRVSSGSRRSFFSFSRSAAVSKKNITVERI